MQADVGRKMWTWYREPGDIGWRRFCAALLALAATVVTCGCGMVHQCTDREKSMVGRYEELYGEPQRVCRVARAEGEIRIDGKLAESDWQKAEVIKDFTLADTGEKPTQQTEVRLLWDDGFLYVSFVCHDRFIYNTYTQPDDPVFSNQDCVEVFLNPDKDPRTYAELDLSPGNVLWSGLSYRPAYPEKPHYFFTAFNPRGLITGAHVTGELNAERQSSLLWSAEYAIPFDCLGTAPHRPPQAGESWRANFYRIDLVKKGKPKDQVEFAAWSPPGLLNFHVPHRFGEIVFVKD